MRFIACAEGASLGIRDTAFFSATRSSEGIAADQSPPTDASVKIKVTASQPTMMSGDSVRTVRAINGRRVFS
nr:hypothetical protein [Streptomyces sp. DSM 41633]